MLKATGKVGPCAYQVPDDASHDRLHINPCLRDFFCQQGSQQSVAWQASTASSLLSRTGLSLEAFEICWCGCCCAGCFSMQEVRTSQRNAAKSKGDAPAPPEQQPASQPKYFPQVPQGSAQQLANFWAQANGQVCPNAYRPLCGRLAG